MCIKTKAFKSFVFRTYAKQGEGGVEGISDQNSARALTSHRSLVTRHCFFSALIDLTPQEWNDGSVRLQQMRGQGLRLGTRKTEPARSTPRGLPASQSSDGWGIDSGVGHCIEIPDRNGASAPRRARFKRGMFMKRFGTALAAVALVACVTAGCNDYGNTFQQNTGALLISLSPANTPAVAAGGAALILTVIGNGFVPKTVVQWDGKNLETTVTVDVNNNATNVTAKVPQALIATPGRHFVNTLNPATSKQDNGLSNTIAFIITVPANPVPVVTSISPTIATPLSPDVPLTVSGSSFVQNTATGSTPLNGSIVVWNTTTSTTNLATTFGSASQLTATVPANLLTTESCASVAVFTGPAVDPNNPTANGGGGPSNAKTFTISANATFCPAAAQASQAAMAVAEETPAVSVDGRFVAFAGTPNGQQNVTAQIFLRDTCEGAAGDCKPHTSVLSAGEDGTAGNADSHTPSISADGRFIAFSSAATNLVADTPSGKQIFLRDTCHGAATSCKPQTQLISVDPNGLLSATDNLLPSVSSSGRFVAFLSVTASKTPNAKAPNAQVNAGQMNTGVRQVFVRDTCLGATGSCTPKTTRISTQPGDANTVGGKPAGPAISGNGSGVGIADNHSATLFTRSVAVDDRVFLAITKSQN